MAFIDRIRTLNQFDASSYLPFVIDGEKVGYISHTTREILGRFRDVLSITEDAITLSPDLSTYQSRTVAFRDMLLALREGGHIHHWREEAYAVKTAFNQPALMEMERAAVPLFGIQGYGVHMNGYVRTPQGLKMWVGRRAKDKPTFPGKLDQMVAGGLPAGIGIAENLVKECWEEAAIPEEIAQRAKPVGTISYLTTLPEYGVRNDVLFNFDLELPDDFTPRATDGEVEGFYLWPIEQVAETIAQTPAFKYNCAAIIVDFLIRWGYIQPDAADYVDLVAGLHHKQI